MLKKLFHADNFRINFAKDAHIVELCGALKVKIRLKIQTLWNDWHFQNVVACVAGFSGGLGFGDNAKAAIIRLVLFCCVVVLFTFLYWLSDKSQSNSNIVGVDGDHSLCQPLQTSILARICEFSSKAGIGDLLHVMEVCINLVSQLILSIWHD